MTSTPHKPESVEIDDVSAIIPSTIISACSFVTPDSFTREARLRGLLETRIPGGDTKEPGRKTPFQGDDTAPTEADGKNSTSARGNASEGFPDLDALVSIAKGETAAAPPPAKEPESRPLTLGRVWAEVAHYLAPEGKLPGISTGPVVAVGNRTPNPENDTGEVHPGNPPATLFGRTGPSIGELTVAQHRQVSQPGDDQHSPDRVHASLEVATKEVMRQHQDGRIDEGPDSQPQVTGSGPATPGQGGGLEQVDGSKPGDPHHPGEE